MADVTGTATQDDLMQLRADLAAVRQIAVRARSDAERLAAEADRRSTAQGAQNTRQASDVNRRLDGLAVSLSTLNRRVDELTARVEALSHQAAARSAAPRAAAPPATPSAPAPAPPPGATPPAASTVPPAVAAAPGTPAPAIQPQDLYQTAYIDFSKGNYGLAIAGFQELLRRFADSPLAPNAQYWIGESHFSLARSATNAGQADKAKEELQAAVQEFRKVEANYPRAEKTPTAIYKEALALIELGEPVQAEGRLRYLVESFPQSAEAPLARERLATLAPSGTGVR